MLPLRAPRHKTAPLRKGPLHKKLSLILVSAAMAWCGIKLFELVSNAALAQAQLGFQLGRLAIPRDEIVSGGVAKDAIPALTNPKAVPARQASHLRPGDRVVGVVIGEESRAYPLKVLTQHEIANDDVGGTPVAVTYCPLCDSVAVFDRRVEGRVRKFGVSGLLHNSNVLMYDRGGQPEGLWSQMLTRGVSGPESGVELKVLPCELTTWQSWQQRFPDGKVIAPASSGRNYDRDPYARYFADPGLAFPAKPLDKRLALKARVLGVWTEHSAVAFPLAELAKLPAPLRQRIDEKNFTVHYDPQARSARISDADDGVSWVYSFWFAWYAFHPETELFSAAAVTK